MRRPRTVRSRIVAVVLVALMTVVGCGGVIPDRVAPTLAALRGAGLRCGAPQTDNVPSGLLEWSCDGLDRGAAVRVLVSGDDKGVFDLMAFVPSTVGPPVARAVFLDLVGVMPAFDLIRPATQSWLGSWTGGADNLTVRRAFLMVGPTGASILLSAIPGPRRAVDDPI